jgi:hypothetical protein
MAINYNLICLVIIAFLLSLATTALMANTIPYQTISDADRYIQQIKDGQAKLGTEMLAPLIGTTKDFITRTNFIFILAIGYLVYSSSKSWRITILALLGFSVSLILYFSLLAQAIVVIISLFLWTKVETKSLKDNLIYLVALIFSQLTHKFGGVLVLMVYLIKRMNLEERIPAAWIKRMAIFGYIVIGLFIFIAFFSSPARVTFFYYFILPISLGPFDAIYWLALFGAIFWMLLKCENNSKELLVVLGCFAGIVINYLFISQLEIDTLRFLILAELIALIKIGQSKQAGNLLTWMPWILLAMGVERLILGLLV